MLRFTKRVALIVKLEQTLATNPSLPPLCIIIIINKTWQQTKDRLCVSNKRTMAVRRRFANRYGYTKERKLLSVYVPISLYFFLFLMAAMFASVSHPFLPLFGVCVFVSVWFVCAVPSATQVATGHTYNTSSSSSFFFLSLPSFLLSLLSLLVAARSDPVL